MLGRVVVELEQDVEVAASAAFAPGWAQVGRIFASPQTFAGAGEMGSASNRSRLLNPFVPTGEPSPLGARLQ